MGLGKILKTFASSFILPLLLSCGSFERGPDLNLAPISLSRFVVLGDTQGNSNRNDVNPYVFEYIVERINQLEPRPMFVLVLGDLTQDGGEDLETWLETMEPLRRNGIAIFPVVGNHDVGNGEGGSLEKQLLWQELFDLPLNGPAGYEELVYSFEMGNIHVSVLDSYYDNGDALVMDEIDEAQLRWLEEDLAHTEQKYKFVATHSPAYPVNGFRGACLDKNINKRDAFWSILDKNDVDISFSGHEHLYARKKIGSNINPNWQNEILQIISGGGGGTLHNLVDGHDADFAASMFHYVVVDTYDDHVTVSTHEIEGERIDRFEIPN